MVITPLPNKISSNILKSFRIGEVEPVEDELLLACYCDIPPIERFLSSNKSILLGGKGTGKTALFTLLKRNERNFQNPKKASQLIIAIDTDIEYTRLKYLVFEKIQSDIPDQDIQFRYLWEIYALYRIITELNNKGIFFDAKSRQEAQKFLDIFDAKKEHIGLLEFLGSVKKTAGFKLDTSNPVFPTPDFYISVEPTSNADDKITKLEVSLSDLKQYVNKSLSRSKMYVYLIVDNIDDFVAREEYEIQKILLQGLIQCARTYSFYNQIKLKLFLRTDLFNNINFSQVGGYDKVSPMTEKIIWRNIDIWEFIGERILWNLSRQLNIREFGYESHGQEIKLEPWHERRSYFARFLSYIGLKRLLPHDDRDSPNLNFMDEAYRAAITSIFPRQIRHYLDNGNVEEVELFDFLDSHFRLGNGELTPRIFIIYLQKVFDLCAEYYDRNPESDIKKDSQGEFPLIKRKELMAAYGWLQEEVIRIFLGSVTNREWRDWLEIFLKKKSRKTNFSYRAIRKVIGIGDDVCIKEFLAFLCHLGVLSCRDKSVILERRHYELPILLQVNHALPLLDGG